MSLLQLVVVAVLQGAAEVLPISPSGHAAVARLWQIRADGGPAIDAGLLVATAAAVGVATRRRLGIALGEGVRAIARPRLFQASPGARDAAVLLIASAASLGTSRLVAPRVEGLRDAPIAVGLGLLAAGVGLASTVFARRGWRGARAAVGALPREAPSIPLAALVGIAHGLAVFPGASRVGAALTVLLWLGVRADRAVDLALLITVPSLLVAAARAIASAPTHGGVARDALAIGVVISFVAAQLAASALRGLAARRRLPALALWIIPLGLALLAYARALPGSGS
ncbi:MAG: undecaprenyl-diphosphate phosphatase [Byssovorax sp.]